MFKAGDKVRLIVDKDSRYFNEDLSHVHENLIGYKYGILKDNLTYIYEDPGTEKFYVNWLEIGGNFTSDWGIYDGSNKKHKCEIEFYQYDINRIVKNLEILESKYE